MTEIKIYILILCVVAFLFFLNAPMDFPTGSIIRIEQGESLHSLSLKLKQDNIIRSRLVFEAFIIIFGKEKHVISADYYLENKLTVYEVAERIGKGEHHLAPVAVTIPEGFDINQISETFASQLHYFDKNKFLLKVKGLEGYLFPDTYFFFTTADEGNVIDSMTENFYKKIELVQPDILASHKTEKEIITMASLVEKEAKGDSDRGFISGILWKRLGLGMPLQADSAPETYKMKGLPKSPIANPGLESIKAAIYPKKSAYLYYLHDKNGNIHYAKNFAEHMQNKLKYLK